MRRNPQDLVCGSIAKVGRSQGAQCRGRGGEGTDRASFKGRHHQQELAASKTGSPPAEWKGKNGTHGS